MIATKRAPVALDSVIALRARIRVLRGHSSLFFIIYYCALNKFYNIVDANSLYCFLVKDH